ncbi:hypothetical protein CPC08DRAFT_700554 [Agrocybe pediades]|nr:hypothetical protein CPC08DRAFT_700554 [Agrocybe pediades]
MEEDVTYCLRQLSHLRCLSVGTQYRSLTAENEPEFIEALKNVASLPSLICLRQFSMFDLLFKQRTHLPYLSICIGEGGLVHLPAEPDPLSKPRNRCQVEFLRVTQGSIARALHRYSRKIHLEQLLDIEKLRCLFILASNLSPFKTQNMLNLLHVSHYNLQEFILYLSSPGSFSSPGEELRVALEELRSLRRLRIRVTDFGLTPCLLMHISWLLMSLPTGAASCLEQISIQTIYLRKPRSRHSPELTLEPWDELWDLVADFDRFPCLTSLEFMGYFGLTHDSDKDVVHPEAMKWQAHLAEKQSFSSRLKVEAKILKYANAINEDDFYPEFWPDDGFRRLLGKNCD